MTDRGCLVVAFSRGNKKRNVIEVGDVTVKLGINSFGQLSFVIEAPKDVEINTSEGDVATQYIAEFIRDSFKEGGKVLKERRKGIRELLKAVRGRK